MNLFYRINSIKEGVISSLTSGQKVWYYRNRPSIPSRHAGDKHVQEEVESTFGSGSRDRHCWDRDALCGQDSVGLVRLRRPHPHFWRRRDCHHRGNMGSGGRIILLAQKARHHDAPYLINFSKASRVLPWSLRSLTRGFFYYFLCKCKDQCLCR